jgi:nucleolar complex protein 3
LSLSFDDDFGRPEKLNEDNNRVKNKKNRKRKNLEEPSQLPEIDKKKSRKQLMTKMREEVFLYP